MILNFFLQFAEIDAKKAEEARRREKPVDINEWNDDDEEEKERNGNGHDPIMENEGLRRRNVNDE